MVEEVAMEEEMTMEEAAMDVKAPPASSWSPVELLGALLILCHLERLLDALWRGCYYGTMYISVVLVLCALGKNP